MMADEKTEGWGLIAQLRQAIRDSGKTLLRLQQESGVSAAQLSRFVRGQRALALPAAEKLCNTLGLGLVYLFKPPEQPAQGTSSAAGGSAPKRGRKPKGD